MTSVDIPAVKRRGLSVDLERLASKGELGLTPEDRYTLKTWGVCPQLQDGVFMIRVRVPGGVITTGQARTLARVARRNGCDWIHLTTRQNAEVHWVDTLRVPEVLTALRRGGLTTRSSCGHTLRNVMCSEDAGLGIDEPFDCFPDARLVSDELLSRSASLNRVLPSRVNLAFGGSPRCREDARFNDGAFVSVVRDGRPGYEVWAGGSLGKAPAPGIRLAECVARDDVVAAAMALIEVFIRYGDLDHPAKGRMKFVLARLGESEFRGRWYEEYSALRDRIARPTVAVEVLPEVDRKGIVANVPPGGWSLGVRPQRVAGLALCTIHVPLGDCSTSELELFADLADRYADGALVFSRDQDVVLRNVPHHALPAIRRALRERGLSFLGEDHVARVRACPGSAVCAIGITTAPIVGNALLASAAPGRNRTLKVHVSGCPNSCAQHQIADLGLAGGKVRVGGRVVDGYQLYVGAEPSAGVVGEVVGRVAADHAVAAVELLVGAWEAMRHPAESLSASVRRVGFDVIGAYVQAALRDRWAPGPETTTEPAGAPVATDS